MSAECFFPFLRFAVNLLQSLQVKEFWKSVKFWQNYGHEFSVQFFGPPCIFVLAAWAVIN